MITCLYLKNGAWTALGETEENGVFRYCSGDGAVLAELTPAEYGWDYCLETDADFETRVHLEVTLEGEGGRIPCDSLQHLW